MFEIKYIVLAIFFGSSLYVYFRGRERLKLTRHLFGAATITAPYNSLMYLQSAVPTAPILSVTDFPELAALRDHWETIRAEAVALYERGHVRAADGHNDLGFNSFFRRGWKRFYLKWYDDFLPSASQLCPETTSLLAGVPSVHAAMFALLPPGAKLVRHRDPFAGSLRYHLGLVTPNSEKCWISIDGQMYHWEDGKDIVFDETYIHRAHNESDLARIILFCDVERPLRSSWARSLNGFMCRHIMRAAGTRNFPGEKVGLLNRIFEYAYQLRLQAKRLRNYSKPLYYGAKYLIIAGALLWFLL